MFQLLCISAVLIDTAHLYERSPVLEDSVIKSSVPSRYSTRHSSSEVNKHCWHSEKKQLYDEASSDNVGLTHAKSQKSITYPRKRSRDKQENKEDFRRSLRSKEPKLSGRGLFKNLRESLKRKGLFFGVADVVQDTFGGTIGLAKDAVEIAQDLIKGSSKLAEDIASDSVKLTGTVLEGTLNISRKAFDWANKTMQIGKTLIKSPLRGIELTINAAWAAKKLGTGLTAQIISDTADWFQGNWGAVKAVEFPGKHLIVMAYPSGLMSVVQRITKDVMYMLDKGHRILSHGFGYSLYLSLKVVFGCVSKVMQRGGLNCIKLSSQNIKVNKMLVGTIHTKRGKVCGISHLKPENNVTITSSDEKFLIVSTPWVLENISVRLTGVRVSGGGQDLLEDETMETTIQKIKASGTVFFEAGTLLRFVRIHIRINDLDGLKVVFPTKNKSYLMEFIETLSDYFTKIVKNEVNHVLEKIEKEVFDYIAKL